MRDSLKKSVEDSPVTGFERYAKGSVVICNACAKPIFKLDSGIALGDKAGKMAKAFKPLTEADIYALARRPEIDAGLRAEILAMTLTDLAEFLEKLHEVRVGDPMLCPVCGNCFAQVLATERHEALDKSYTVELLTVPPESEGPPPPLRGKQLGVGPGKDWVH